MSKIYVLDTSVLIQSPSALNCFEDNTIVLTVSVLEELDVLKSAEGEKGANARQVIRYLENLRSSGNLVDGVALPGGGTLRLELNYKDVEIHQSFADAKNDNRILRVCLGLKNDGAPPIIVTRDIMLRIKAQVLGIASEDFSTEQVSCIEGQYTGRIDVYAPDDKLTGFKIKKKGLSADFLYTVNGQAQNLPVQLVANQFVTIQSELSKKKTLLGRFDGQTVVALESLEERPFGVKPRNAGQRFLQEALMKDADNAPLVIVKGPAGTAKTFYALAVGLHKLLGEEERKYRRILITRPHTQFDDDIGFLPGSEQEKIAPLLRPIMDNLEILVDRDEKLRYRDEGELRGKINELFDREIITAEAMNFIRGRSITHTWLIIDEAQNLTPKQAKGIITRAGKGTKIILLGDPNQIDHPLLDERTNGLSYASEKMKDSALCWQITMKVDECERSKLSGDASARM
ncbi:MAG: PhoH family protein [Peptococcaceae bacterium]|nr:PhoH family protein [Peptococcaceae bacterium]